MALRREAHILKQEDEDSVFDLYRADGTIRLMQGKWVLCDNGYHKWSCMIPPMKDGVTNKEIRWSKWMESLRKDIECTFGILKGRWRILKTGIRLHGTKIADDIFLTCCALHNMLLEIDGLHKFWREGVKVDYSGEEGRHETNDVETYVGDVGVIFNRVFGNSRDYDITRIAPRLNVMDEEEIPYPTSSTQRVHLRTLSQDVFRGYLIEHFHYLWTNNMLIWPSRTGVMEPLI